MPTGASISEAISTMLSMIIRALIVSVVGNWLWSKDVDDSNCYKTRDGSGGMFMVRIQGNSALRTPWQAFDVFQ
jgi:hypothetical protein